MNINFRPATTTLARTAERAGVVSTPFTARAVRATPGSSAKVSLNILIVKVACLNRLYKLSFTKKGQLPKRFHF